jgi:hypothetical protein
MFKWLFGSSKSQSNKLAPPPANKKNDPYKNFKKILEQNAAQISYYTRSSLFDPSTRRTNASKVFPFKTVISQTRNVNRTVIHNKTLRELDPGVYLFLITYNNGKFFYRFSKVDNIHEIGSRHYLMINKENSSNPNPINFPLYYHGNNKRFIVVAGEVRVPEDKSKPFLFNLESGTFTVFLERIYSELMGMNSRNFLKKFVANKLKLNKNNREMNISLNYTNSILIPQTTVNLEKIRQVKGLSLQPNAASKLKKSGLPHNFDNLLEVFQTPMQTRSNKPVRTYQIPLKPPRNRKK